MIGVDENESMDYEKHETFDGKTLELEIKDKDTEVESNSSKEVSKVNENDQENLNENEIIDSSPIIKPATMKINKSALIDSDDEIENENIPEEARTEDIESAHQDEMELDRVDDETNQGSNDEKLEEPKPEKVLFPIKIINPIDFDQLIEKISSKINQSKLSNISKKPALTFDTKIDEASDIYIEPPSMTACSEIPYDIAIMYKNKPNVTSIEKMNGKLKALKAEQKKKKKLAVMLKKEEETKIEEPLEMTYEDEEEEQEYIPSPKSFEFDDEENIKIHEPQLDDESPDHSEAPSQKDAEPLKKSNEDNLQMAFEPTPKAKPQLKKGSPFYNLFFNKPTPSNTKSSTINDDKTLDDILKQPKNNLDDDLMFLSGKFEEKYSTIAEESNETTEMTNDSNLPPSDEEKEESDDQEIAENDGEVDNSDESEGSSDLEIDYDENEEPVLKKEKRMQNAFVEQEAEEEDELGNVIANEDEDEYLKEEHLYKKDPLLKKFIRDKNVKVNEEEMRALLMAQNYEKDQKETSLLVHGLRHGMKKTRKLLRQRQGLPDELILNDSDTEDVFGETAEERFLKRLIKKNDQEDYENEQTDDYSKINDDYEADPLHYLDSKLHDDPTVITSSFRTKEEKKQFIRSISPSSSFFKTTSDKSEAHVSIMLQKKRVTSFFDQDAQRLKELAKVLPKSAIQKKTQGFATENSASKSSDSNIEKRKLNVQSPTQTKKSKSILAEHFQNRASNK